jgi:hypothetical protein
MFRQSSTHIFYWKNLAEHWDLPNTWIFILKMSPQEEYFRAGIKTIIFDTGYILQHFNALISNLTLKKNSYDQN